MTVTAGPRRPQSRLWSLRKRGQVATTMVTAQMPGARKGRTTQRLPKSNPPRARMIISVRGRLLTGVGMRSSGGASGSKSMRNWRVRDRR